MDVSRETNSRYNNISQAHNQMGGYKLDLKLSISISYDLAPIHVNVASNVGVEIGKPYLEDQPMMSLQRIENSFRSPPTCYYSPFIHINILKSHLESKDILKSKFQYISVYP